jgi:hypothetical protein
MSHDPPNLDAALAARVSRLPQQVEPPVDLWPAIAARLGDRDDESLAAWAGRLAREVDSGVDLWPAIEARLENPTKLEESSHTTFARSWVAMVASLAAITVIVSIAGSMLSSTERASLPERGEVARAVDTIRLELVRVQGARLAIEESLQRDGDNLALHALWLHAYQTELDLAGKAEQLFERYPGV